MAIHIQLRRGSASAWVQANPILAEGEPAIETDTGRFKVGNGVDRWVDLPYSSGEPGPTGPQGPRGAYTTLYARTLSETDIADKFFELPDPPTDPANVRVDLVGAGIQIAGRDYLLTGKIVSWNALEIESLVAPGDEIVVMF